MATMLSNMVFHVLLIFAYITLNISLNLSNKWLLSIYGFRFPILLSMLHMAFSFIVLAPFMFLKQHREQHIATIQRQWLGLIGVGTFFAINVGFNNVSLLAISLSLNQVIRASIPVVTAVGAVFVESKVPSKAEFLSLIALAGGVGIAVYESSGTQSSFEGVLMCLTGTVCNGLMMTFIGKLTSEKLDVVRLTFYTAPISCLVLLPFHLYMESAAFREYNNVHESYLHKGIILLTCVNALAYNMIHSLVIKVTSSVTTTVLGEMKIVMILVLSAFILGEARIWTLNMIIGSGTAILGFCMYSHCKISPVSTQVVQSTKLDVEHLSSK